MAISDVATIDVSTGCVTELRQLDTTPQTATTWSWTQIRQPSTSSASLSATDVRNPTFTPDVADSYVFRLDAAGPGGRSITTVSLTAEGSIPSVATHPASIAVCAGHSASFSVAATGATSWQWKKNDSPIAGATSSTYTIPSVATGDAGSYSCIVTNGCGPAPSNAASLIVVTACGGAKPVPDGMSVPGTPLEAGPNATDPDLVDLTWDAATCTAGDYNLYRGSIGSFVIVSGGSCSLGVAGARTKLSIPGDSWWVVGGTDGGVVSSFGRSSTGAERLLGDWGSGGVCPTETSQDGGATCP